MKKTLLLIIALFLSVQFFAQDRQSVSTQMNNARFEVIQSPIARKYTFFLDKVEGKVYQLVQTRTGGDSWQEMRVYPKDTQT